MIEREIFEQAREILDPLDEMRASAAREASGEEAPPEAAPAP